MPQALKLDEGEELIGSWIPVKEIFAENKPHVSCDLKTIFCFLLWKSL